MQLESSIATRPPEPMSMPRSRNGSGSSPIPMSLAGMMPESGPPGCTPFRARPAGGPPAAPITTSLTGVPNGTSRMPTRCTCPDSENIFVPLFFSVPMEAYQSAPWRRMRGTLAYDSTLLTLDGLPNTPACAGKGGRILGMPRESSTEEMRPVSSPQT